MVTSIAQPTNQLKQSPTSYGLSCSAYEQATTRKLKQQGDTLVIAGYGCQLRVQNNALLVAPGKTYKAQCATSKMLYRGVHGVKHIIILSQSGGISLDAIQWCKEQEIVVTMIDESGNLLTSITPEQTSNVALRRCQYTTPNTGIIAARIIECKIQAQLKTLQAHSELPQSERASEILENALKWFDLPELPPWLTNIDYLRLYEARAANAYFEAWQGLPIKWDKASVKIIPPHWKRVTERGSPLSKGHGARYAVNPAMAMLNYAYAILESQCRQALTALGFDISCGIMHADNQYRDSLLYDLMDMHRASVDHLVLKMLGCTTFSKGDIMQQSTGECKFNPELCRYIAATCKLTQSEIDASASWLKAETMR